MSALEPSSNFHLRWLLRYLRDVELLGIFDAEIAQTYQCTPIFSPSQFSVMGFSDVLKQLPFFMNAQNQMVSLAQEVDKVLIMDSSSFHIPLAKKIKQRGYKCEIIYYILPQVWAWKKYRAKSIEKYCDRLAAILPFEVNYYQHKAEFVGHPLLDVIPPVQAQKQSHKITFMPGSRRSEICRIFPTFSCVAQKLRIEGYETHLVIPPLFSQQDIAEIYGDTDGFILSNSAQETLQDSAFAFICSGTATLEAALLGTPFVLGYRAKSLDYFIARRLMRLPNVGLANIFFEKMGRGNLHHELLQDDLSEENLLKSFRESSLEEFLEGANLLRKYLQHGSAQNVAEWIQKI